MHALYATAESEPDILTEHGEAHNIHLYHQPPPTLWNGYQLDCTIGRGEFAKVKLAYDLETQEPVAIKFLQTPRGKGMCTRGEAKLIVALNHPNIVPVLAVHPTEEGTAIVMHYCPDGELFGLVERKNGLDEDTARGFFLQLISALDYLHNTMEIVHRDIKLVTNKRSDL